MFKNYAPKCYEYWGYCTYPRSTTLDQHLECCTAMWRILVTCATDSCIRDTNGTMTTMRGREEPNATMTLKMRLEIGDPLSSFLVVHLQEPALLCASPSLLVSERDFFLGLRDVEDSWSRCGLCGNGGSWALVLRITLLRLNGRWSFLDDSIFWFWLLWSEIMWCINSQPMPYCYTGIIFFFTFYNSPSESDISLASADAPVEFSLTSAGVLSPDVMVSSSPIIALRMLEGSQPSFPSAFTYHISAKQTND